MAKRYDTDTTERGLIALAVNAGNTAAANRQLARDGVTVPVGTLRSWKDQTHRERYLELCSTYRDQIDAALVAHYTEAGIEAAQGAHEAITSARAQLAAGDVKDASAYAYRLSLAAGILQDKARILQDRATNITEHRDIGGILAALEASIPQLSPNTVDSTADELEPAVQLRVVGE